MTIVRIVVASPNDVQAERNVLPVVVEELNAGVAGERGLRLDLSRWETDVYPGFHPEGPQGLIDDLLQIEECDVLIGVFWKRFGTPTHDAKSGTEHEFRRAYQAWQQKQRPQIMVYFNQKPSTPRTLEEIDQWRRVLEFQQNFPKEGLWWSYKGKAQFERLVRNHLTRFIRQQQSPLSGASARLFSSRTVETVQNVGKGALAIGPRATAASQQGIAVGGHVYGDVVYHMYQTPPGNMALTQAEFARILERYLRWVQDAYSKSRLYGLESLPTAHNRPVRNLAEVFVPLTLRRVQQPRRDEVEHLAEQLQGDKARAYLRLTETRRKDSDRVLLNTLLTVHNKIAIIGGAGSGKSTLLAYLATRLAAAALTHERIPVKLPRKKAALVPLLIPLRYFREYLRLCETSPQVRLSEPRAGTLAGFIPWYLRRRSPALETSEDFFDRLLRGGGCLLMLDGLDEVVSREDRGRVRQQVEDLVNDVYPDNLVVVTAREAGYREDAVFGDDFVRLDVQLLNDDQIRTLVASWCRQLYPGEEKRRTDELVHAIQDINNLRTDRDLPPFVSTPLMTTMVVSVKWGETELPRERAKLYEACVKVILQAQYVPDDAARKELVEWGGPWEEQRNWLAVLALAMHEGGRAGAAVSETRIREVLGRELSPESLQQFLEAVRHRGGLLEERAELFQFVHLTFQEFLVARWLAKQRHEAWPHFLPHLMDPWWREVFLLTYGFAQVDHPPFARDYLQWLSTQSDGGERSLAGLELAGAALLELEKLQPEIRQQQAARLTKALTDVSLSASGVQRARAGDTLARLGDPRFRADAWYLPDESLLGFVEIPAGPFLMGSDPEKDEYAEEGEQPQHTVELPTYYMARYPVTVAQFRAFVERSGYHPADKESLHDLDTHPVVNVTWYDAMAYCHWLTEQLRQWPQIPEPLATILREGGQVTLPSEAEWEKAARGVDGRLYPWGNEFDANKANMEESGINRTSAVGCFPKDVSPYGVMDLAGNVWEWTRSLGGKDIEKPTFRYPYDPNDGRENLSVPNNVLRVLRGGAFWNNRRLARCAYRNVNLPGPRLDHGGISGGGAPKNLWALKPLDSGTPRGPRERASRANNSPRLTPWARFWFGSLDFTPFHPGVGSERRLGPGGA